MKSDPMHHLRLVTLLGLSALTGAALIWTAPGALAQTTSPASSTPAPLPPAPDEILPTTPAAPFSPTPASPVPVSPVPANPVAPAPPSSTPVFVTPAPLPTTPLPTTLERVSASLKAVQAGTDLTLNLTLLNGQANALAFSAGRDSSQNCAAAPLLRVLKVGTREVVYPLAGEKRICTQELSIKTAPLGGSAVFGRTLKLAPGEYVVESWFQGFAGPMNMRVRLSAPPLRISVK
ncbi:hypothetical protein [Deinococcus sp.]|uniref:hypothetical protein n=1 Tax=Deinococcus sp. TaxID=47478 RepID=UPI0025CF2D1A|nr:hypothetical protein [Deinococcus sp.]